MTIDIATITQVGIAVFSACAAWLTNDRRRVVRRWAPIFGLLSQPFWLISSFQSESWGIFFISNWYSICWVRGIRSNWFTKAEDS